MMRKIWIFCRKIYDPGVHLYFAMNWSLSFAIYLIFSHSLPFDLSLVHFIPILTLFFMLFILRIVDEIKDYEYDQIFHKDRPLVSGDVNHRFLLKTIFALTILCLGLNTQSSLAVLAILLADIVYSFLLIWLEKKSPWVKDNMLINLVVTYPVNLALSFYLLSFYQHHYQFEIRAEDYLMIAAFAFNFLYYEFARKIGDKSLNKPGEKLYSDALGLKLSVFVTIVMALVSISLLMSLYQSNLPLILLLAPLLGLFSLRQKKIKRPMMLSGSLFLGLFYTCVFVLSFVNL